MGTKDVFHDWDKVLFNLNFQSIRVSGVVEQFTIFVCSFVDRKHIFLIFFK